MDENIFIDIESTHFEPGQRVTGKILWAVEKAPKEVSLTLGWSTEGRGTTDHKVESELKWETEALSGEEPFEFTLPASPYSFDGSLISLSWELSLSLKKGKAESNLPITVSPNASPITLSQLENESKRKPFSFKSN